MLVFHAHHQWQGKGLNFCDCITVLIANLRYELKKHFLSVEFPPPKYPLQNKQKTKHQISEKPGQFWNWDEKLWMGKFTEASSNGNKHRHWKWNYEICGVHAEYHHNLNIAMQALLLQSCPTLCNPVDCSPPGSSVHGDSPGKNNGVSCHFLLQGILPTQGLNLDRKESDSATREVPNIVIVLKLWKNLQKFG